MRPALRNGCDLPRREPCVSGDDLHDNRRDIVDAAIVVRVGDHGVDDSLRVCPGLEELLKPAVLDHSRETVGSEEEYVADFCLTADDVRLDVARHSDAAGDDVALGVMPRLLGGDDAGVDLFLNE